MRTEGIGGDGGVWLWDGATQYEGRVVSLGEGRFSARVRRKEPGPRLGKRVPLSFLELQRQFRGRRFLGHLSFSTAAPLVVVEIENVLRSSDGTFDYFLSGTFRPLSGASTEVLSKMSLPGGAASSGCGGAG